MGLPKPSRTRPSSPGPDFDAGVFAARDERVAQLQAVDFFQRHGKHAAVAETDDLGANAAAGSGADLAEIADGDAGAAGFHQQADDFGHLAGPAHRRNAVEFGVIGGERNLHECFFRRSARPRSISCNWESTEASRLPRWVSKIMVPTVRDGIGDHLHFGGGAVLAQTFGEQGNVCGVDPYARDFLPAQFLESAEDQAMESFGIDGEFATQDATGNGKGKLYQVGFGLGAQAAAQAADFLDGSRHAVDDWLYFGGCPLAPEGLSLTQSGGVSFARALFGLLLQLRDALPGIGRLFGGNSGAGGSGGPARRASDARPAARRRLSRPTGAP